MIPMNSVPIVLNELSLPGVAPGALREFARTLAAVRRNAHSAYLVSDYQLWGDGRSLYTVFGPDVNDASSRDHIRMIALFQNRAPYRVLFSSSEDEQDGEYYHGPNRCLGLGYAHCTGSLSVSLLGDSRFDSSEVMVRRVYLQGEPHVELLEQEVSVPNAARSEHVEVHRHLLDHACAVDSPLDMFARRSELFPNLEFLPRVGGDVRTLELDGFRAVLRRLQELNEAVGEWKVAEASAPVWRSHITPDSSSRCDQGLLTFAIDESTSAVFSWHARYTPGAGRIHFLLNSEERSLLIGYIGPKIE